MVHSLMKPAFKFQEPLSPKRCYILPNTRDYAGDITKQSDSTIMLKIDIHILALCEMSINL